MPTGPESAAVLEREARAGSPAAWRPPGGPCGAGGGSRRGLPGILARVQILEPCRCPRGQRRLRVARGPAMSPCRSGRATLRPCTSPLSPCAPLRGGRKPLPRGKRSPGTMPLPTPRLPGHRGRPLNSASTLRAPLTSPGTASRPPALQGSRARPRPPPHWAPRPSLHRARGVREAAPGPPVRAPGLGGESPLPPSARSAVPGLGCSSAAHTGPPWR